MSETKLVYENRRYAVNLSKDFRHTLEIFLCNPDTFHASGCDNFLDQKEQLVLQYVYRPKEEIQVLKMQLHSVVKFYLNHFCFLCLSCLENIIPSLF